MDAKECLPRMEREELLRRYNAGERFFVKVDLSGLDLSRIDFSTQDGNRERVRFNNSDLTGVNFVGANLSYAFFFNANLRGANLEGADLTGVNFENANLTGAILVNCNLFCCGFVGANMTSANLTGSKGGWGCKDTIFSNTIMECGNILSGIY